MWTTQLSRAFMRPRVLAVSLAAGFACWMGTAAQRLERDSPAGCTACDLVVTANSSLTLEQDTTVNCVEIDGTLDTNGYTLTLTGPESSVIDGRLILRQQSTLRIEQADHTISSTTGNGRIEGHSCDTIAIRGGVTLTSMVTICGTLQIRGLAAASPRASHGQFVNNGTVHANVASGKILVVGNSLLGAGTGEWKVDTASAVLEFDAGSACGTEIGDLTFDAGGMQIDADVTFNAFHWDGGTINGTDTKRMRYETFSSDTGKGNPNDGTQSCGTNYFYVDDYPKS